MAISEVDMEFDARGCADLDGRFIKIVAVVMGAPKDAVWRCDVVMFFFKLEVDAMVHLLRFEAQSEPTLPSGRGGPAEGVGQKRIHQPQTWHPQPCQDLTGGCAAPLISSPTTRLEFRAPQAHKSPRS